MCVNVGLVINVFGLIMCECVVGFMGVYGLSSVSVGFILWEIDFFGCLCSFKC